MQCWNYDGNNSAVKDNGEGISFVFTNVTAPYNIALVVPTNEIVDNVTINPMLNACLLYTSFLVFLLNRFKIERARTDRSGVYAYTQKLLAYNSNKIEGSTLTEEQTASLFDTGYLPKSNDYYRAKDVEEMNGHFLMFNKMLDTLEQPLNQELIKEFHYELKSGVFEDRANGYAIGDYKKRPNMIGMYQTVSPSEVAERMTELLDWYFTQKVNLEVLAEFHMKYESIHPFQDGNGRTGRLIVFRECLRNGLVPLIIEDRNRNRYLEAFREYREEGTTQKMVNLFLQEQSDYREKCRYFEG